MRKMEFLRCVMRDGCELATDVYLPDGESPSPLILLRTPYGRAVPESDGLYGGYRQLTRDGYAVAYQDMRGTGDSEGTLGLNGQNEHEDGYDAVEWLAAQPFCNGKIGMFGLSYPGFVQTAAAAYAPPHLLAICPFMSPSQTPFGVRQGTARHMAHLYWAYGQLLTHPEKYLPDPALREKTLPILQGNMRRLDELLFELPIDQCQAATLEGVPMLRDYLDVMHSADDPSFWTRMHMPIDFDKVHTAAFFGTGWLDGACEWTIKGYRAARRSKDALTRENARLLIGPWPHGGELPAQVEDVDYGAEASGERQQVADMMRRWFDRHLRGMDTDAMNSRVRYFILGANRWASASDWPPPDTVSYRLYLAPDERLTEEAPQSAASVEYEADPMRPTPSAIKDDLGRSMTAGWTAVSRRSDVAFFSTPPLREPITVAGVLRVDLFASSEAPDTDFACRLLDVAPDGRQTALAAGLVRASERNGMFVKTPLTPGETVEYVWEAGSVANTFQAGHRIGVQICSYLYPDYNRNLNTGEPAGSGTSWRVAHQRLHTGGLQASCVELPVKKDG